MDSDRSLSLSSVETRASYACVNAPSGCTVRERVSRYERSLGRSPAQPSEDEERGRSDRSSMCGEFGHFVQPTGPGPEVREVDDSHRDAGSSWCRRSHKRASASGRSSGSDSRSASQNKRSFCRPPGEENSAGKRSGMNLSDVASPKQRHRGAGRRDSVGGNLETIRSRVHPSKESLRQVYLSGKHRDSSSSESTPSGIRRAKAMNHVWHDRFDAIHPRRRRKHDLKGDAETEIPRHLRPRTQRRKEMSEQTTGKDVDSAILDVRSVGGKSSSGSLSHYWAEDEVSTSALIDFYERKVQGTRQIEMTQHSNRSRRNDDVLSAESEWPLDTEFLSAGDTDPTRTCRGPKRYRNEARERRAPSVAESNPPPPLTYMDRALSAMCLLKATRRREAKEMGSSQKSYVDKASSAITFSDESLPAVATPPLDFADTQLVDRGCSATSLTKSTVLSVEINPLVDKTSSVTALQKENMCTQTDELNNNELNSQQENATVRSHESIGVMDQKAMSGTSASTTESEPNTERIGASTEDMYPSSDKSRIDRRRESEDVVKLRQTLSRMSTRVASAKPYTHKSHFEDFKLDGVQGELRSRSECETVKCTIDDLRNEVPEREHGDKPRSECIIQEDPTLPNGEIPDTLGNSKKVFLPKDLLVQLTLPDTSSQRASSGHSRRVYAARAKYRELAATKASEVCTAETALSLCNQAGVRPGSKSMVSDIPEYGTSRKTTDYNLRATSLPRNKHKDPHVWEAVEVSSDRPDSKKDVALYTCPSCCRPLYSQHSPHLDYSPFLSRRFKDTARMCVELGRSAESDCECFGAEREWAKGHHQRSSSRPERWSRRASSERCCCSDGVHLVQPATYYYGRMAMMETEEPRGRIKSFMDRMLSILPFSKIT